MARRDAWFLANRLIMVALVSSPTRAFAIPDRLPIISRRWRSAATRRPARSLTIRRSVRKRHARNARLAAQEPAAPLCRDAARRRCFGGARRRPGQLSRQRHAVAAG